MAQDQIVPILFVRYKGDFEEQDWSMMLSGPYEVTNPLQSMVMEAGSKGEALVIQASLVPVETLFPELGEEPEEAGTIRESEE